MSTSGSYIFVWKTQLEHQRRCLVGTNSDQLTSASHPFNAEEDGDIVLRFSRAECQ